MHVIKIMGLHVKLTKKSRWWPAMLWVKAYYKHFVLMFYVRNNKIKG